MAGLRAGPLMEVEVPIRPASTGSADLWLPGSTRFTSPVRLSPRTALRGLRGLAPRKITEGFVMNSTLLSSTPNARDKL
jgi:hypothetical protein